MKITNIPDLESFTKIIAGLVKQGVCFVADAQKLIIELTGGY